MRGNPPAVAVVLLFACIAAGLGVPSHARATQPVLERTTDHASPGQQLVLHSLSLIGVRYRRGGNSPETGLDCSGLVKHVFGEVLGFELPRRSEEMSRAGTPVPVGQLQPGDLVFFNTLRRAFSHVGIYVGENRFVHAPSTGGRVRVESIGSSYWKRRFNGARRVAPDAAPPAGTLLYAGASASEPASQPTRAERIFATPIVGAAAPVTTPLASETPLRRGSLLGTIYSY